MLTKVMLEGTTYGTAWTLAYISGEKEEAVLTIKLSDLKDGCVFTDVSDELGNWWYQAPEAKAYCCTDGIDTSDEENLVVQLVVSRATPNWCYNVAKKLVASLCYHIWSYESQALLTRGQAIMEKIAKVKAAGLLDKASDDDLFGGDPEEE